MGHSHGMAEPGSEGIGLLRLRLGAVFILALAAASAQLLGAVLTGSIALLAESAHMAVDLLGIAIAFGVTLLPVSMAAARRRRLEAISALIQSTLLVGVGVYALIRGLQGLVAPHPLAGGHMLIFASAGLVANLTCVAILYSSRRANLNFRAAFLEVISDALGSLVVIGAGLAVLVFGFYQADALATLALAGLMIPRGASILLRALAALGLRRRLIALLLLGSLAVGLGTSQIHRLLSPTHRHTAIEAVDRYSWSEPDGVLELSFSAESGVATLSDGCSSARAPYARSLGGASFGTFYLTRGSGCESELEALAEVADSAYYTESFRELILYSRSSEVLTIFGSEERERDQESTERWKPMLDVLFAL